MKKSDIGPRIINLLDTKGVSQSDLARFLGIKPQAVQKWKKGGGPRHARLQEIAEFLGMNYQELTKGTVYDSLSATGKSAADGTRVNVRLVPKRDQISERSPTESADKLPLISWAQAGAWAQLMDNFPVEDAIEWIEAPRKHGRRSFYLTIRDESNYNPGGPKSYTEGEIVLVDPDKIPKNRSTVVVKMAPDETAVLRQLLTDGDSMMLKALNPGWPNALVPLPLDAELIGTVIGKWVDEE